MKKQSTAAKSGAPVRATSTSAPPPQKRLRDGISSQGVARTQSSSHPTPAPAELPPPMETVVEEPEEETTAAAAAAAEKKKKEGEGNNGHKVRKMADVMASCHKTKYLPLADGINTSNVYFQPQSVSTVKRNWVDVSMKEFFIGGGLIEYAEQHTYSLDADDLLRMLYLAEMINNDDVGIQRTSFEQWTLDIFSKILADDSHADYSDRGRIAEYAMMHTNGLCVNECPRLQILYQKRCIYDMEDVGPSVILRGENLMCVKTKSVRSKFEYLIEAHIICVPDEENEGEMKRNLEQGEVPSMN